MIKNSIDEVIDNIGDYIGWLNVLGQDTRPRCILVLHNVFLSVTGVTLLVGHTASHDIVDQLFSIWARILSINNATTYEQMHRLAVRQRPKCFNRVQ